MNTLLSEQQLDHDKLAELLYLSRHYSGYTSEAAVVELANYPTESSIDAILARVNEWVTVIRKQAQL